MVSGRLMVTRADSVGALRRYDFIEILRAEARTLHVNADSGRSPWYFADAETGVSTVGVKRTENCMEFSPFTERGRNGTPPAQKGASWRWWRC